jgi:hypothetical protein
MRRFIGLVFCATLLFAGIGGLIDQAGAKFKSDEKALALLQRARQAIGGEVAIRNVRSMTIVGKSTLSFDVNGTARSEQGDVEINFELPNKMSKQLRFGASDGKDPIIEKDANVVVIRKGDGDNVQWRTEGGDNVKVDGVKRVIVKKPDGTEEVLTEDVKPMIIRKADGNGAVSTTDANKTIVIRKGDGPGPEAAGHHNELFRTTLSLLLSAPEGLDVSYTYAGEGTVDGSTVDIIDAAIGSTGVKLYLDRSTSIPRMISYKGAAPVMVFVRKTDDGQKIDPKAMATTFERNTDAPEMIEIQVKYSDYRSVGGVLLPFRWTQTVGGKTDTTDITIYEINPSNISDKFKEMPTKVVVRTNK